MKNGQRIFNLFIFALMILGIGHIDLLINGTNGNSATLLPYHMGACVIALIASLLTLRESFRAVVGK